MSDLDALPKAELHLHIEGTLEPELAFELAQRNGVALPYAGPDELRAAYEFDDLQSFLDVYYATMAALLTREDFRDLVLAYAERAVAEGVAHVEPFFDPQAHLSRGVDLAVVVEGLQEGLRIARNRWGISSALIMCFLRDRPPHEAAEVLERVTTEHPDAIVGVGLDSAEVGYPPSLFREVFQRAAELGLHRVAHAGEEAPPSYIWEALDLLGAERIDHGVRALDDPELLKRLAAENVPLTVCPLSNVRLRVVDSMARHPLPELLEAGLLVTVNSDDPAYFGGYAGANFAAVRTHLGLDDATAAELARNSIQASFLDPERAEELLGAIAAWEEQA